jgi:integrase
VFPLLRWTGRLSALREGEIQNFYVRHFLPAVQRAGLPEGVRFHDLRHTHCSILIGLGSHPKAIMERLGHSSITVTLNTYGHPFPEPDESLTGGLEEVLAGAWATKLAGRQMA